MNKNILNDIQGTQSKRAAPSGVVRLARGIVLKPLKETIKARQSTPQKPKRKLVSDSIEQSPPSFEKALVQTYPILIVLILLAVAFF